MVVRMRSNRSHTGHRRGHFALKGPRLSMVDGVVHIRHRASLETGMYRGKKVLDVHSDLDKKLVPAKSHKASKEAK